MIKTYTNPYILHKVIEEDGKIHLESHVELPPIVPEGHMRIAAYTQHEMTHMQWSKDKNKEIISTHPEHYDYWKPQVGKIKNLNKTFEGINWELAKEDCLKECKTAEEAFAWIKDKFAND